MNFSLTHLWHDKWHVNPCTLKSKKAFTTTKDSACCVSLCVHLSQEKSNQPIEKGNGKVQETNLADRWPTPHPLHEYYLPNMLVCYRFLNMFLGWRANNIFSTFRYAMCNKTSDSDRWRGVDRRWQIRLPVSQFTCRFIKHLGQDPLVRLDCGGNMIWGLRAL